MRIHIARTMVSDTPSLCNSNLNCFRFRATAPLSTCTQISITTCCNTSTLSYDRAAANSSSLLPPEEKILNFSEIVADDQSSAQLGTGAVPMGSAINRSFISARFLLSAYFLTAQTYKHMCLITQVYGIPMYYILDQGRMFDCRLFE